MLETCNFHHWKAWNQDWIVLTVLDQYFTVESVKLAKTDPFVLYEQFCVNFDPVSIETGSNIA